MSQEGHRRPAVIGLSPEYGAPGPVGQNGARARRWRDGAQPIVVVTCEAGGGVTVTGVPQSEYVASRVLPATWPVNFAGRPWSSR